MYTNGAKAYFDMLACTHRASRRRQTWIGCRRGRPAAQQPGDPSDVTAKRAYSFRHAEDMRAIMVQNGDDAKQVAIMEMGWTTDSRPNSPYAWHAVTPEQQADYLVKAFQYAKANWSQWAGPMVVL